MGPGGLSELGSWIT